MKSSIVLAALLLTVAPLDAQVRGKKHGNKGTGATSGKKSRVTGSVFDRDGGNGGQTGAAAKASAVPSEVRIRLGDRVRGFVGEGASHRAVFEAVTGTRVTIKVTPADRKLTLAARLLGPDGAHLVTPSGKPSDPAVLRLDDFVCPRTGSYTLEVSFAASQAGDYLVETAGDHPDRIEDDVAVAGRRPTRLTLSGLGQRSLSELKLRALEGEDLDLWLQIVDPDGITLPLDDASWRSADGKTILVSNVALDRNGDYQLSVMDRGNTRAKLRVQIRYDDAGPTRKTHEL